MVPSNVMCVKACKSANQQINKMMARSSMLMLVTELSSQKSNDFTGESEAMGECFR
jgi:hypothetical protein